jgi:ribokinase
MSVCVLGSLNLDVVCYVAELPRPGETVLRQRVDRLPGGEGANQAVAAGRCNTGTRLIGAIGRDEAGETLLAAMADAGVETADVLRLADYATGQAFIWVSKTGENSIVVAGGANLAITPTMLNLSASAHCRVLLAQLETPVSAIEALFAEPVAGRLRLLNAAPAVPDGRRLFPLIDILIVNEAELAAFVGVPVDADDAEAVSTIAQRLISRPDQTVVVTLGKAGALAIGSQSRIIVPGRPANAVDTTGAGDCFCGVLAARLDEGAELEDALEWANTASRALHRAAGGQIPGGTV